MSREKTLEEHKKIVGSRIRQARLMSDHDTIASLNEKFPDWSNSRLGNYETGTSLPNPLEILRIAKVTETSPCWIAFGIGSIRSMSRDIQAIRHQNLTYIEESSSKSEIIQLRKDTKLKPTELVRYLNDPFLKISDNLSHKIERSLKKRKGWMDEQHIESDGLCEHFPEDIREILSKYSDLDEQGKKLFLGLAKSLSENY